jgi:hypothetical protein
LLPLGPEVDWAPVEAPRKTTLRGEHVLLRPVDADADAGPLYEVSHPPGGDAAIWTYLHEGPYDSAAELREALARAEASKDPLFFTVVGQPEERPLGIVSYLRIEPAFGTIEIGNIWFGSPLQRTRAASERSSCSLGTRSTTSATAGSSGSATRSTPPLGARPSASAFVSRASSANIR